MKMRTRLLSSLVFTLLGVAGCAAPNHSSDEAILSEASVQVITALNARPDTGPVGVSDVFVQNGKMVAFVSFVWPTTHTQWGHQVLESRWYMGERLVIKRENDFLISRSPYHLVSNVLPLDLGVGSGHYELWANGRKLGEKYFNIVSMPTREDVVRPKLPDA